MAAATTMADIESDVLLAGREKRAALFQRLRESCGLSSGRAVLPPRPPTKLPAEYESIRDSVDTGKIAHDVLRASPARRKELFEALQRTYCLTCGGCLAVPPCRDCGSNRGDCICEAGERR